MKHYSKSQRKKLRQLRDIAYELELDRELAGLYQDFQKWRNKEIDGFELNELIHKYHQGPSREVWKTYNYIDLDMVVSRAVALGLLKKEDIQEDILELIDTQIDFFSGNDERE
jgi:hypothetical protein